MSPTTPQPLLFSQLTDICFSSLTSHTSEYDIRPDQIMYHITAGDLVRKCNLLFL